MIALPDLNPFNLSEFFPCYLVILLQAHICVPTMVICKFVTAHCIYLNDILSIRVFRAILSTHSHMHAHTCHLAFISPVFFSLAFINNIPYVLHINLAIFLYPLLDHKLYNTRYPHLFLSLLLLQYLEQCLIHS